MLLQITCIIGHIIKPFDINLLQTLGILIHTQSVSLTAKRLGVSQPTVSRALTELRGLLGDPLLIRSGRGMNLTPRAEELAGPLEQWMAMTSTVLLSRLFTAASLDRKFRVAATDFGVLSVVSPTLPSLTAEAPGCRLEMCSYSDDMFRQLASGDIDLIIYGFAPDPSLAHSRHLFRETQSIVIRPEHPLCALPPGPIPLDDYLAWPHIAISIGTGEYDHARHCLRDRDAERRVLVRLPYFYAAPSLIGSSEAILTMPTRAATALASQHGLICRAAPIEIADFDYWLLWHERSAHDPATSWLVDKLSTLSAEAPCLRHGMMTNIAVPRMAQ